MTLTHIQQMMIHYQHHKDRRLITDKRGYARGCFFIPPPVKDVNPRWATGIRTIRFTSSEKNSMTPGTVDSSAETNFAARGTLTTVQETIHSVRDAQVVMDTVTDTRTVTSTRTEVRQIGWYDPLAQSFLVDTEGGVFLTGVDIYFGRMMLFLSLCRFVLWRMVILLKSSYLSLTLV